MPGCCLKMHWRFTLAEDLGSSCPKLERFVPDFEIAILQNLVTLNPILILNSQNDLRIQNLHGGKLSHGIGRIKFGQPTPSEGKEIPGQRTTKTEIASATF